jgi:hypothetical protein
MTPAAVPTAAVLAWRRRRWLRRVAIVVLLAALIALLVPAVILAMLGSALSPGREQIGSTAGLPAAAEPWVPLVNIASDTFEVNAYLLLAILSEETAFGTHPDTYGPNFLGCCYGPFQLNLTDGPPSTWDTVKDAYRKAPRPPSYHHPATPHPSVYDSFDAAMAAALLLRRKVGGRALPALDATAWEAARSYNGTGPGAAAYADRVLARARAWARDVPSIPGPTTMAWPVRGAVVSPFGMRWGRLHAGIDIAAPAGTPIRAASSGRVLHHGWVGGYGNFTCLAHGPQLSTCYAHQSRFARGLADGIPVTQGAVIGYVGCTGRCYGDHLHFEVHTSTAISNVNAVDPLPYLEGRR